jgi:hypothetical protein
MVRKMKGGECVWGEEKIEREGEGDGRIGSVRRWQEKLSGGERRRRNWKGESRKKIKRWRLE